MSWFKKWIWVNVNLWKLAENVTANLSFGITGWKLVIWPSVNFNKAIHSAVADVSVSAGASLTWAWADVTASHTTWNKIDEHSINMAIWIWVGVWFTGKTFKMFHASITENSSSNVEGFNRMMETAKENLPIFVNRIEKGWDLTKDEIKSLTWWAVDPTYVKKVKEEFERVKELYTTAVWSLKGKARSAAKAKFEQALLVSTANRLYRNQVTWFKITGIGAFLIPWVIWGIFALWEYNYVTYTVNKDKRRDRISESVTTRWMKEVISEHPRLKNALRLTKNWIKVTNKDIINVDKKSSHIIEVWNTYKAAPGYVPVFNLNLHYSYDKNIKKSYVVYTLTLDTVRASSSKWTKLLEVNNLWVKNKELDGFYSSLNSVTNAETRRHKSMDVVMDPNKSIDDRWRGIEAIAKLNGTKFEKAVSKIVEEAKKDGLTEKEKMYIVSTITQLAKKAHDTHQWDIGYYNKHISHFITMDKWRRKWFDKMFGFNSDRLAKAYYSRLRAWKWHITDANMHGAIAFDASSSLHVWTEDKRMKGVDVLYSNIQALGIDGKLLTVPLHSQETKAMLKTLQKKVNAWVLDKDIYKKIILAVHNGYKFAFYKDADWFDDRIWLFKLGWNPITTTPVFTANASTDIIEQHNESVGLADAWTLGGTPPTTPPRGHGDTTPKTTDKWEIKTPKDDLANKNKYNINLDNGDWAPLS